MVAAFPLTAVHLTRTKCKKSPDTSDCCSNLVSVTFALEPCTRDPLDAMVAQDNLASPRAQSERATGVQEDDGRVAAVTGPP